MKALIDFDVFLYSCGFAAQKTCWYDEKENFYNKKRDAPEDVELDNVLYVEPVENALNSVKMLLSKIMKDTKADGYVGYITGPGNFREEVAITKPYKGNRKADKPFHYQSIKTYLLDHTNCRVVKGIEADDMLGIEQCNSDEPTVICSIDKDLDMIPGWHYNWNAESLYYMDEESSYNFFLYQMLVGDSVDNIVGVPKVGDKKAKEMEKLNNVEEKEDFVWGLYVEYFNKWYEHNPECAESLAREMYNENEQLLWIMRDPNE